MSFRTLAWILSSLAVSCSLTIGNANQQARSQRFARQRLTRLEQSAGDVDGAGADGRDGKALLLQLRRVLRHDHVLRALRHAVRRGLIVPPFPHNIAHASARADDDDLLGGALP